MTGSHYKYVVPKSNSINIFCFKREAISQICNGLAKLGKKNYKTEILTSLVVFPLCHWFKVVGDCVG